jgi:hypothetical protein
VNLKDGVGNFKIEVKNLESGVVNFNTGEKNLYGRV